MVFIWIPGKSFSQIKGKAENERMEKRKEEGEREGRKGEERGGMKGSNGTCLRQTGRKGVCPFQAFKGMRACLTLGPLQPQVTRTEGRWQRTPSRAEQAHQ